MNTTANKVNVPATMNAKETNANNIRVYIAKLRHSDIRCFDDIKYLSCKSTNYI